jgi:hypothetical protein
LRAANDNYDPGEVLVWAMAESEGLRIARERIVAEAQARTGFLDLGQFGLTQLLADVLQLKHLRTLNFGAGLSANGPREAPKWASPRR